MSTYDTTPAIRSRLQTVRTDDPYEVMILTKAVHRLNGLQELVNLAYPLVYGMETHGSKEKLLWQKNWLEAAEATGASLE